MVGEPLHNARRGTRRAALAVGGLGLVGAALAGVSGVDEIQAAGTGIEGAWIIRWGGQTRQHVRVSAFLPGGVVIISDSPIDTTTGLEDAEHEVDYRGPALGQWLQTGFADYAYTTVEVDYDARGNPIALTTYRGAIQYDVVGDSLKGMFRLSETALDGRVIATRESAFTGTRIKVGA
jgi:hypothetical protein